MDFVNNVLPPDKEGLLYYVALMGRKKYYDPLKSTKKDNEQISRFVCKKSQLYEKIKGLEVEEGTYTRRGVKIPQEALALYINPNPRNTFKATQELLLKLTEDIINNNRNINPVERALTYLHKKKAKDKSIFVDFDYDVPVMVPEIPFLNRDAYRVIKTRGGYHFLIEPSKVSSDCPRKWYLMLQTMQGYKCDKNFGDIEIPFPGGCQGTHTPHFI